MASEQGLNAIVAFEKKRRSRIWRSIEQTNKEVSTSMLASLGLWIDSEGIHKIKLHATDHVEPLEVVLNVVSLPIFEDEKYALLHLKQIDSMSTAALTNLKKYGLPIFFLDHSSTSDIKMRANIGWLLDYDVQRLTFFFSINTESGALPNFIQSQDDFTLVTRHEMNEAQIHARIGQPLFKFSLIKYYGSECAFCGLNIYELLEAAHIFPYAKGGTHDPRNGLLLCRNHHKAFDCGLIKIRPNTLSIEVRDEIKDQSNIIHNSISHLPNKPHSQALEWAWKNVNWC